MTFSELYFPCSRIHSLEFRCRRSAMDLSIDYRMCVSDPRADVDDRWVIVQEPKAARREMLASLLAAGAVLVSTGNALAASGPGNQGAKRVAKKADQLLKAGDDLINNDSPPRFAGPDGLRTGNNNIAQQ